MPLAAGTRLGPYEIVSPLGAGGMGEVYKGRDTRLDRVVAIKVLPAQLAADPQHQYAVAPDGQRLLINQITDNGMGAPITVAVNWAQGR